MFVRCTFVVLLLFVASTAWADPTVMTGIDRLFSTPYRELLRGKRVGFITNQTGIDSALRSSIERLTDEASDYRLVALFAPEHGLDGAAPAAVAIPGQVGRGGVPIYSLYGETRRPTEKMLEGIDLLLYDIQDVGVRCYTYSSTLFYIIEEAAKRNIEVVVLDRPNPLGGTIVDGPMLHEEFRSFIGYSNVPFIHGMTMGELALYFNGEYHAGCRLTVVPMKGWRRNMTFAETGLPWVPTSPMIPEPDTPLYYASTGILGEALQTVSVGVGTSTPFKVVGAPWIDAHRYAEALRRQELPGVHFHPCSFQPFFGRNKNQVCHGVRLIITEPHRYKPIVTQYMMLGLLKSLYPDSFQKGMERSEERRQFFYKMCGSSDMLELLNREKYVAWPLVSLDEKERAAFLVRRTRYLLYP